MLSGDLAYVHSYRVADRVAGLVQLAKTKQKAIVKEYTIADDGVPEWVPVEKDPVELLADTKWLKHEPLRQSAIDMERGTTVHEVVPLWWDHHMGIRRLDEGDLFNWVENQIADEQRRCDPNDVYPYCLSLWRWLERYAPAIMACDCPVFHDALGYAGTIDVIWVLDSRVWLVDLKSSKATAIDHACQIAAYRHAQFAGNRDTQKRTRMPKVDGTAILLVQPGKCTYREWDDTRSHFEVFKHILCVYKAMKAGRHAETVKGLTAKFGE